jgi:hypothetical protein
VLIKAYSMPVQQAKALVSAHVTKYSLCTHTITTATAADSTRKQVCSEMHAINDAKAAMDSAEARVAADADGSDTQALEDMLNAMATFEAVGGYTQDKTVAEVYYFLFDISICMYILCTSMSACML